MTQRSFPLPNWAESYLDLARSKDSEVAKIQDEAASFLREHGFPNTKNEAWHYTDLSKLEDNFSPKATYEENFNDGLLFVDGVLTTDSTPLVSVHSNPKDVLALLESLLKQSYNPFGLLALLVEPTVIEINRSLEIPLKLRFVTTGGFWVKPLYIKIASGVSVTIQEYHLALSQNCLAAPCLAAELGCDASLCIDRYQIGVAALESLLVKLDARSTFKQLNINATNSFSRNNINALLQGENAEVLLHGLNMAAENAHIDNHIEIDHISPATVSNTVYRGVYNDKAKGNFDGAIIVRPQAQKTVALQSTKSILLSETASSNAKPELKIWADDVKCSHGATVGQLDEEALFYLQSRGLPYDKAKTLLVEAFAAEILNEVKDEKVKEEVIVHTLQKICNNRSHSDRKILFQSR